MAVAMPRLSKLGAEDLSSLCAGCHPSWAEVAETGPRGIGNVRHQIYRLTASRCYDTADKRIACNACHDPHGRKTFNYDSQCAACHTGTARQCSVAKSDCVRCHMPKVELPGLHAQFTDHRIRIVRPGAKYPD